MKMTLQEISWGLKEAMCPVKLLMWRQVNASLKRKKGMECITAEIEGMSWHLLQAMTTQHHFWWTWKSCSYPAPAMEVRDLCACPFASLRICGAIHMSLLIVRSSKANLRLERPLIRCSAQTNPCKPCDGGPRAFRIGWTKKNKIWISTSIFCMCVLLGKTKLHDSFQIFRPISDPLPPIWSFTLLQWENRRKNGFGHNFWLEDSIDLRTTRLNYILQDLFRDIPLDHIWSAQICIFAYLANS